MASSFDQEPTMRVAEYVLGTLSADEVVQLERELEYDRSLQQELAYWEEQLGQLGLDLPPADPPAAVWDAIHARLYTANSHAQPTTPPTTQRSTRLWQGLAAAASIIAVVLAGLLYVTSSRPPETLQPTYASMFFDQPTSTGWLVTANAASGEMSVTAMGDYPLPQGKELRLWIIPKGGQPIASGIVPADGHNSWHMSPRVARLLRSASVALAVSLETAGQPVRNGPQGPILWQAPMSRRPDNA